MVRLKALGFRNARNVGLGCLRPVAGPAEDLQVVSCVCAAKCEGKNVINVPRLAGFDLLSAGSTEPIPHEEQVQPERG